MPISLKLIHSKSNAKNNQKRETFVADFGGILNTIMAIEQLRCTAMLLSKFNTRICGMNPSRKRATVSDTRQPPDYIEPPEKQHDLNHIHGIHHVD